MDYSCTLSSETDLRVTLPVTTAGPRPLIARGNTLYGAIETKLRLHFLELRKRPKSAEIEISNYGMHGSDQGRFVWSGPILKSYSKSGFSPLAELNLTSNA